MVVEVANSGIHWMEPRDLHVGQMTPRINSKSGQGISSRHPGGAHGLLADGSVRYIPELLTAEELRAWLTRNGGELNTGF
jgi:prepilin-type processing-associated H-X9-DG protein